MKERILNYMKENGSITTWEAIKEFGCTRLSEYIRQLRTEMIISDDWECGRNRYGELVRYKIYYLGGNENV